MISSTKEFSALQKVENEIFINHKITGNKNLVSNMQKLDVKDEMKELKKTLAKRLKEELNGIKQRAKEEFELEEEPLIFYFHTVYGPVYFLSEEGRQGQNKPPYVSNGDLNKFGDLISRLDGEETYDLHDALVTVRFGADKEYMWIFFNGFEIDNNLARGGKERFQFGIVSKNHEVSKEMLNNVGYYLQNELQEYFIH